MTGPARLLLVIGTSSAGKTSACRRLQDLLPEHALLTGIDALFAAVSPRWGGGQGGPLATEGFRYHREEGPPATTTIVTGPVGMRVHAGYVAGVGAQLAAGNHVVVDEMLLAGAWSRWDPVLGEHPHAAIRLTADLGVLERREELRLSEPGLARGHLGLNAEPEVDCEIDTGELESDEVARVMFSVWKDILP